MKYESNLTNIYNLESDDRLTLPDDTISVFEYDMIKGNLKGEKISGGNWIKLASMPAKVNVYWNSKYDRQTAKLLNESNRGVRILKQNDSLRLMTFQNFYIWTEGDLEDVENWTDKQRRLVIETSGAGAEIEALIANPSSDIYVDKVESVGDINHLINFGKKDTAVEAGKWAKDMKQDSSNAVSNTESIKENTTTSNENEATIIENLEALNTTQTSVKENLETANASLDTANASLDTANASLDTANASLDTANASLEAIKTEQSKQGTQLETSNANTKSAATSLLAIKDKQATDSLTLTNMSTNLMAINTNTQGLAKDSNLTDFKSANHTDLTNLDSNLTEFKGANHTDLTNLSSKIETGLSALSQGLQLLNLEATQQSIVEKINTINLQLNTLNTLLQNGLNTNIKYPNDLTLSIYSTNDIYTTLQKNHKWHMHSANTLNLKNVTTTTYNRNTFRYTIECNYQIEYEMLVSVYYNFSRPNTIPDLTAQEKIEIMKWWSDYGIINEISLYENAEGYQNIAELIDINILSENNLILNERINYETINTATKQNYGIYTNNQKLPERYIANRFRLIPLYINMYCKITKIYDKVVTQ